VRATLHSIREADELKKPPRKSDRVETTRSEKLERENPKSTNITQLKNFAVQVGVCVF
jgi:hypothetical protein